MSIVDIRHFFSLPSSFSLVTFLHSHRICLDMEDAINALRERMNTLVRRKWFRAKHLGGLPLTTEDKKQLIKDSVQEAWRACLTQFAESTASRMEMNDMSSKVELKEVCTDYKTDLVPGGQMQLADVLFWRTDMVHLGLTYPIGPYVVDQQVKFSAIQDVESSKSNISLDPTIDEYSRYPAIEDYDPSLFAETLTPALEQACDRLKESLAKERTATMQSSEAVCIRSCLNPV